jgi:hypothetical protein
MNEMVKREIEEEEEGGGDFLEGIYLSLYLSM